METIKIGLLVDSLIMPAWALRVIELVLKLNNAQISVVVEKPSGCAETLSDSWGRVNAILLDGWFSIDDVIFRSKRDADAQADASAMLKGVPVIRKAWTEMAQDSSSNESMIDPLLSDVTMFLQLGRGQARRRLLREAPWGVWVLQHGERAGPDTVSQVAWEILQGKKSIVTTLDMYRERGGVLEVAHLYQSRSATTPYSLRKNINRCHWKSASFVSRVLRRLLETGLHSLDRLCRPMTAEEINRLHNETLGYKRESLFNPVCRLAFRLLQHAVSRMFAREQWALLYAWNKSSDVMPAGMQLTRLVPPKDRFWADPCVVRYKEKYAVFVEELQYSRGTAHLSAIEFDTDGKPVLPPVKILEKNHHLSYPHVFSEGETLYMIPETYQNRNLEIYRCLEFPNKWEFVQVLIHNIVAVDATIWHHEGKYWLFVNVIENEGGSADDELFLFYSDTLLSNEWKSHPHNPIISDAGRARPAGNIFNCNGNWYRPSQDCIGGYGKAISINRIDRIDEAGYEETAVSRIGTPAGSRFFRTHTFSRSQDLVCFDGMMLRSKL